MSVSDEHRLAQRDKVLLAARKCFIRRGFHATGMAEISKACRMSVGNIYHYLPNKGAIVRAIADETRSRMLPVLRRLENHPKPVEGIVEIILFGVREFCRAADARLWIEIAAEAPRNRFIREVYLRFDREIRDVLKGLIQSAIAAGQISRRVDMEALSLWLVALLDGALARVSLDPGVNLNRTLDTLACNIRRSLCAQPA
ncbi:MAG TPA: TetR/AcrR family transcriptional regulator [Verrucomicrobiota bacterium]|nr:TetR/AcrR family transcriptional regulator [Verrucomicrobiota bacterium]HQL80116.1 TetR/AcrR family transcriptional regulator [Verrucomicrobiota bacterium]